MKTHAHRWIVVAAIISVGAGAALSHLIEPGVRVEKIMLTTNTPALRIFPTTPGPHPIALMAHGNGGSKEMLFRFGEALAAAGFECNSVDLAGYGESPQPAPSPTSISIPRRLIGHLERRTSSSAIRWAVALAAGACVKRDFAQSSSLGSAPRSGWASTGRRSSCWQVYLRNFGDQPSYTHERMRR
jgi:hypothetical protein